ncbi:DUF3291 domain-containing protein [Elongatibacter sediminis]|uniref:DUF3291 domain-containing protein n=1 Tax=Elongatibacter sediminis TaxID=3119006 RepID=A0AAW9R7Q7_9GAMM
MPRYELAQLNIARLAAPLDSPQLADFVANLDRINTLAEASPGFVWRLQTEEGDATGIRDFGEEYIVNLSVWEDVQSLHDYVYRTAHTEVLARRREWFERMDEAYAVLWWVEAGHRPDTAEARERLEQLRAHGPTPAAFTFKQAFPPPSGRPGESADGFADPCPAT